MLLADEFFLLAHDDMTGKPKLHLRVAGYGLAGALLGELILEGRITVRSGAVSVLNQHPPSDALAHLVLDQLVNESEHRAVRVWLDYLGQNARDMVGDRLVRAGVVRRHEARRLLRAATTYRPVDINTAAWPVARLRGLLDRAETIRLPDAVLLGLVVATDLTRPVLSRTECPPQVARILAALPPGLRELLAQIEAAAGAAVISPR